MRLTVVLNPNAGNGSALADLERWIAAAGHHGPLIDSDDAPAVDAALRDPGDLVVVAGGDGSVRSIAQRLLAARTTVPLAILPAGTANNVATSHGITRDYERLVHGWTRMRRVPLDVGRVHTPWGTSVWIEACGFGAIARTVGALTPVSSPPDADTEDELLRDLRVTRELLVDHPLHTCRLWLDGQETTGEYVIVEVMNIPSIGANLVLAPDATASDGLLDIVTVDQQSRVHVRDYLTARLEGRADPPLHLPVRRARRVRLTWEGSRIHVDDDVQPDEESAATGRYWGADHGLTIEIAVVPAALTLLADTP